MAKSDRGIVLRWETPEDPRFAAAREVMAKAVEAELARLFGESPAKALVYYVGPSTVSMIPLAYEQNLERILGEGAGPVIEELRNGICLVAGRSPKTTCKGISNCLDCILKKMST